MSARMRVGSIFFACLGLTREAKTQPLPQAPVLPIPIDFRCDNLRMDQKTHRHQCVGHVVIRRDTTLVCCEAFEAIAASDGSWNKLICRGDVRVLRGQEALWADSAEFAPQTGDMQLTGRPLLQRQKSLVAADKVYLSTQKKRARIVRPHGTVYNIDKDALPEANIKAWLTEPLAACPLPRRPKMDGT